MNGHNPLCVWPGQVWRRRTVDAVRSFRVTHVSDRREVAATLCLATGREGVVKLGRFPEFELVFDPRRPIDLGRIMREVIAQCLRGEETP